MRLIGLIISALLLMPGTALGAWTTAPGGGNSCGSLAPGNSCYYDFDDDGDSGTTPLYGDNCLGGLTVSFDPDTSGAGTGAEVQVYYCDPGVTPSAANCTKVLEDADGDGDIDDVTLTGVASTGRDQILGVRGPRIFVDATVNAGADDARVTVTCGGATTAVGSAGDIEIDAPAGHIFRSVGNGAWVTGLDNQGSVTTMAKIAVPAPDSEPNGPQYVMGWDRTNQVPVWVVRNEPNEAHPDAVGQGPCLYGDFTRQCGQLKWLLDFDTGGGAEWDNALGDAQYDFAVRATAGTPTRVNTTPPSWQTVAANQWYGLFDATNEDIIELANDPNMEPDADAGFTFGCNLYMNNEGNAWVAGFGAGASNMDIFAYSSGTGFRFLAPTGWAQSSTFDSASESGQWITYSVRYGGNQSAGGTGEFSLVIDGVEIGAQALDTTLDLAFGTYVWTFFSDPSTGPPTSAGGRIDDCFYAMRPWTDAEVCRWHEDGIRGTYTARTLCAAD
ncbi:MAG: hypothetical protein ACYSWU_01260 [Planctomycetota bacterium]|jgi:hypothetical protein